MLGNLCIVIDGEGAGEWAMLFALGIEGFSVIAVVSCMISVDVTNVGSLEDTDEGTKNFGLLSIAGLMDETEGDWNKLVGFPPPLLKVSTYLTKHPMQTRVIKV